MKALVLNHNGVCLQKEHPRPIPGPNEALIRISLAGICGTDLQLARGYADFAGVLGHEFVGRVEASAERSWVGRRVVGAINIGCGECVECERREARHCKTRSVVGIRGRDGCFAELMTLPCANLFAVPQSVSDSDAVFAEPLAAALRIRSQLQGEKLDRVAIVGPGRLGLLAAQVLAPRVDRLVMVGRRESSLVLPRQMGFEVAVVGQVSALERFDVVVETSGSGRGVEVALGLVRPRGCVVLKSTFAGSITIDPASLVVPEVRLIGSRCGSIRRALELMDSGAVDLAPLVEARYPLSRGLEAFRHAARPGVRKVLIEVS